jgi:hypothetical protein
MRFEDDVPISVVNEEMRLRMPSACASCVVRSAGMLRRAPRIDVEPVVRRRDRHGCAVHDEARIRRAHAVRRELGSEDTCERRTVEAECELRPARAEAEQLGERPAVEHSDARAAVRHRNRLGDEPLGRCRSLLGGRRPERRLVVLQGRRHGAPRAERGGAELPQQRRPCHPHAGLRREDDRLDAVHAHAGRPRRRETLVQLLRRSGGAVAVDPDHRFDAPRRYRHDPKRPRLRPERAPALLQRGGRGGCGVEPQRRRRPDPDDPVANPDGDAAVQPGAQLALEHVLCLRRAQAADIDARDADAGQHVLLVLPPAHADRRRDAGEHGDEEDCERAGAQTPAATAEHALH